MSALLAGARAQASRINGAKSRGPRTEEGRRRASQNALKHGLRAQRFTVLADEDAEEFEAFAAAIRAELAPEGALQGALAERVAIASWRLQRADRMEALLFERYMDGILGGGDLGLALIRDGNGPRAFDTLLRYRGATLAELWRSLRALKALQAEDAPLMSAPDVAAVVPVPRSEERRGKVAAISTGAHQIRAEPGRQNPNEPERRKNPAGPDRRSHRIEAGRAAATADPVRSPPAGSSAGSPPLAPPVARYSG